LQFLFGMILGAGVAMTTMTYVLSLTTKYDYLLYCQLEVFLVICLVICFFIFINAFRSAMVWETFSLRLLATTLEKSSS
jgi:hypothetical protein